MNNNDFVKLVSECTTKAELHRRLNIPYNGTGCRKINSWIERTGAKLKPKTLKWEWVEKVCPVCHKTFKTQKGHPREKTVCSHGCSNTYFRSEDKNPNWKEDSYRSTCFLYHEKKCVCCDERLIVAAHHYDGDKTNNNPENLIPMCSTHHQYWHSRYRHMIEDKVNEYRNEFIQKNRIGD